MLNTELQEVNAANMAPKGTAGAALRRMRTRGSTLYAEPPVDSVEARVELSSRARARAPRVGPAAARGAQLAEV